MKKRIITTVLAFACTVMCAFGLMACGGKKPAQIEHFYATDGVDNNYTGKTYIWLDNIAYGETADLSKYKLFLYYTDGSSKEVARNDAKLTVKYYTYAATATEADKQEVDALPDNKTCGNYVIEYTYDGNTALKASVNLYVDQAESGNFTLHVHGGITTWQVGEPCHSVDVKNPRGGKVTEEIVNDGSGVSGPKQPEKKDDTDGIYDLYLFKKDLFNSLTEAGKQNDYNYLYKKISEENGKDDPNIVGYYPEYAESPVPNVSAGDWVLVALIYETYNYRNIVSAPIDITITAAAAVA